MDFEHGAVFARRDLPTLVNVPASRLGNWLDRLTLWQDMPILPGANTVYRLTHLFDLVGLAGMIDIGLPAADAASITRNFGFYRTFLHNPDQCFRLSKRRDRWSASWSSEDIATVSINTRAIGQQLLDRIAALDLAPQFRESFDVLIAGLASHGRIDVEHIAAARGDA